MGVRTDLIRELRGMTVASRLKRLGDRLKSEATRVYQDHGIDFNDSWFLVALTLSRYEQATVTEIAESMNVSRAAVSQMASAMTDRGLVTWDTDPEDRRRRQLRLTPKGVRTVEELDPLWKRIGVCTEEMIEATGQDLMAAITSMENQLEKQNLIERVAAGASVAE